MMLCDDEMCCLTCLRSSWIRFEILPLMWPREPRRGQYRNKVSFQRVHASDAMRVTTASQTASLGLAAGTLEAMPNSLARMWAVKRDAYAPSQDSAGASLLDWQTWWSRVTNVGPVRHRAIDSSDLRLTR